MRTETERQECGQEAQELIEFICENNEEAKEYLNLLLSALRIIDDVYDEDYPITKQHLMAAFEILFVKLPLNIFYQTHQKELQTQHVIAWNTWEVSNVLNKSSNDYDRMYAQVLSGYIHELLPYVAYLIGGYAKMKKVNGLIRSFYQGPLEEKNG